MSFLRVTRACKQNINPNDVCRMFWLGSSPYIPKPNTFNISTFMKKGTTTQLTHSHKNICNKKIQGNNIKHSANYSTNKKIPNETNCQKTADNLRFNVICSSFGLFIFTVLGGQWRPGWEFHN